MMPEREAYSLSKVALSMGSARLCSLAKLHKSLMLLEHGVNLGLQDGTDPIGRSASRPKDAVQDMLVSLEHLGTAATQLHTPARVIEISQEESPLYRTRT